MLICTFSVCNETKLLNEELLDTLLLHQLWSVEVETVVCGSRGV
jgi:hypothetical protein